MDNMVELPLEALRIMLFILQSGSGSNEMEILVDGDGMLCEILKSQFIFIT